MAKVVNWREDAILLALLFGFQLVAIGLAILIDMYYPW
jgi:hypothetical protein